LGRAGRRHHVAVSPSDRRRRHPGRDRGGARVGNEKTPQEPKKRPLPTPAPPPPPATPSMVTGTTRSRPAPDGPSDLVIYGRLLRSIRLPIAIPILGSISLSMLNPIRLPMLGTVAEKLSSG